MNSKNLVFQTYWGGFIIMRKMKFFVSLMMIGLFLCKAFVQSDYQVSIGETFTYTVNNSYWNIKLGSNSSIVSKFELGSDSYPIGTSFEVEVTNVTYEEVCWNLTTGTNVYSSNNDPGDLGKIHGFLFYLRSYAFIFATGWYQDVVDRGPRISTLFFLNTDEYPIFDFFRNHVDSSYLTSEYTWTNNVFRQIEGHFDESGALAIFDWVLDGSFEYTSPSSVHVDGSERFKIAFDKTTGVLQGYRIELNCTGVVENQNYEMNMNQEVCRESYNLPEFHFKKPDRLIPGFEWYIPLIVFVAVTITATIHRKRINHK